MYLHLNVFWLYFCNFFFFSVCNKQNYRCSGLFSKVSDHALKKDSVRSYMKTVGEISSTFFLTLEKNNWSTMWWGLLGIKNEQGNPCCISSNINKVTSSKSELFVPCESSKRMCDWYFFSIALWASFVIIKKNHLSST